MGVVRLGQLRLLHHRHHRGVPVLLRDLRRRRSRAGQATARFGAITTVSVAVVAVTAPVLGALADYSGIKKRLLAIFMAVGVTSCAAMAFIGEGDIGAGLGAVLRRQHRRIGVARSSTTRCCRTWRKAEETDRVSAAGYALGYVGGGLLLLLNLAWILQPQSFGFADRRARSRRRSSSVAVWWAVFSMPLFRGVPEPPARAGCRTKCASGRR